MSEGHKNVRSPFENLPMKRNTMGYLSSPRPTPPNTPPRYPINPPLAPPARHPNPLPPNSYFASPVSVPRYPRQAAPNLFPQDIARPTPLSPAPPSNQKPSTSSVNSPAAAYVEASTASSPGVKPPPPPAPPKPSNLAQLLTGPPSQDTFKPFRVGRQTAKVLDILGPELKNTVNDDDPIPDASEKLKEAVKAIANTPEIVGGYPAHDYMSEKSEDHESIDDEDDIDNQWATTDQDLRDLLSTRISPSENYSELKLDEILEGNKTPREAVMALLSKLESQGAIRGFEAKGNTILISKNTSAASSTADINDSPPKLGQNLFTKFQEMTVNSEPEANPTGQESIGGTKLKLSNPLYSTQPPPSLPASLPKPTSNPGPVTKSAAKDQKNVSQVPQPSSQLNHCTYVYYNKFNKPQKLSTMTYCLNCDPTTRTDKRVWMAHLRRYHLDKYISSLF